MLAASRRAACGARSALQRLPTASRVSAQLHLRRHSAWTHALPSPPPAAAPVGPGPAAVEASLQAAEHYIQLASPAWAAQVSAQLRELATADALSLMNLPQLRRLCYAAAAPHISAATKTHLQTVLLLHLCPPPDIGGVIVRLADSDPCAWFECVAALLGAHRPIASLPAWLEAEGATTAAAKPRAELRRVESLFALCGPLQTRFFGGRDAVQRVIAACCHHLRVLHAVVSAPAAPQPSVPDTSAAAVAALAAAAGGGGPEVASAGAASTAFDYVLPVVRLLGRLTAATYLRPREASQYADCVAIIHRILRHDRTLQAWAGTGVSAGAASEQPRADHRLLALTALHAALGDLRALPPGAAVSDVEQSVAQQRALAFLHTAWLAALRDGAAAHLAPATLHMAVASMLHHDAALQSTCPAFIAALSPLLATLGQQALADTRQRIGRPDCELPGDRDASFVPPSLLAAVALERLVSANHAAVPELTTAVTHAVDYLLWRARQPANASTLAMGATATPAQRGVDVELHDVARVVGVASDGARCSDFTRSAAVSLLDGLATRLWCDSPAIGPPGVPVEDITTVQRFASAAASSLGRDVGCLRPAPFHTKAVTAWVSAPPDHDSLRATIEDVLTDRHVQHATRQLSAVAHAAVAFDALDLAALTTKCASFMDALLQPLSAHVVDTAALEEVVDAAAFKAASSRHKATDAAGRLHDFWLAAVARGQAGLSPIGAGDAADGDAQPAAGPLSAASGIVPPSLRQFAVMLSEAHHFVATRRRRPGLILPDSYTGRVVVDVCKSAGVPEPTLNHFDRELGITLPICWPRHRIAVATDYAHPHLHAPGAVHEQATRLAAIAAAGGKGEAARAGQAVAWCAHRDALQYVVPPRQRNLRQLPAHRALLARGWRVGRIAWGDVHTKTRAGAYAFSEALLHDRLTAMFINA